MYNKPELFFFNFFFKKIKLTNYINYKINFINIFNNKYPYLLLNTMEGNKKSKFPKLNLPKIEMNNLFSKNFTRLNLINFLILNVSLLVINIVFKYYEMHKIRFLKIFCSSLIGILGTMSEEYSFIPSNFLIFL